MKKIIVFLCVLLSSVYLSAREDPVILHNGGSVNDRYDLPMPADMPDVYYNNVYQTIIVEGTGEVEYYDVKMGKAVDGNRTQGAVIIPDGVNYEIEASGKVTLEAGFKVERGAFFATHKSCYK